MRPSSRLVIIVAAVRTHERARTLRPARVGGEGYSHGRSAQVAVDHGPSDRLLRVVPLSVLLNDDRVCLEVKDHTIRRLPAGRAREVVCACARRALERVDLRDRLVRVAACKHLEHVQLRAASCACTAAVAAVLC